MKKIFFYIKMVLYDLVLAGTKKVESDNDGANYFYAEYLLVDPRLKGKA